MLRQQGCNEIQGFLLARPMPGAEVQAFLRAATESAGTPPAAGRIEHPIASRPGPHSHDRVGHGISPAPHLSEKSFCFFFQKEGLFFFKKTEKTFFV